MADMSKVIQALEICKNSATSCGKCPYRKEYGEGTDCVDKLLADAEELLKTKQEDELMTTAEIEGGGSSYFFVCGECHGELGNRAKYCSHCGRKVDWVG